MYITSSIESNDFSELINFNADLVIFFRGEYIPQRILDKINGIKVAISTEPFPKVIDNKFHYTPDFINEDIILP